MSGAPRLLSDDDARRLVMMLTRQRYGQTVLDLGAEERSATRQRALQRLRAEEDGRYY